MDIAISNQQHALEQFTMPQGWHDAMVDGSAEQPQLTRESTNHSGIALSDAVDAFILDGNARQLSVNSIRFYRQQLAPFVAFMGSQNQTSPEAIRATHIRAYLVSLQQRGLKERSVHAAARAIRAFCNFMEADEVLQSNPMKNVRMPRLPTEIPEAFSSKDVSQIMNATKNVREQALVLFLLDTGCRAAECVALNTEDVDLETGTVMILKGKGKKDRTVFMGDRACAALTRYLHERKCSRHSNALWTSYTTGEHLTTSGLRQLLQKLGKRAGVKNCSPHTFRRTFALWSLRAGMNIYALQRIMGHSDLSILRRYLALTQQDLQTAHRQFGAVDHIFSTTTDSAEG